MPQLDTATYRGQVTWLRVIFGGLYRRRTGEILPKLNRIVKRRSKKRDRRRGEARQYEGERMSVEKGYTGRLGNAGGSSYGFLQERGDVQNTWMNKEVTKRTRSGKMEKARSGYMDHRMTVKLAGRKIEDYVSKQEKKETSKEGQGVSKVPVRKLVKNPLQDTNQ